MINRNARTIVMPAQEEVTLQELVVRTTHVHGQLVEFATCYGVLSEDTETFVPVTQQKTFAIVGPDYLELLQADPEWSPGKPAGLFRDADLLAFMDVILARPKVVPDRTVPDVTVFNNLVAAGQGG